MARSEWPGHLFSLTFGKAYAQKEKELHVSHPQWVSTSPVAYFKRIIFIVLLYSLALRRQR